MNAMFPDIRLPEPETPIQTERSREIIKEVARLMTGHEQHGLDGITVAYLRRRLEEALHAGD